jgi:ATP-dependent exoDNAse (exonuclease V) alpha subunit
MLCGAGGSVRAVLAPAGYGKTAMVHAAARAVTADGRNVIAVATTAKAVAELGEAGLPAMTVARFRREYTDRPLPPGSVVVLDEVSQTSTRDAHTVLVAVAACPSAQVWVLGDARQAPAVQAGGIAAELDRRAEAGTVPVARLTVNRRQRDRADRHALARLRAGDAHGSQALRGEHGWEHQGADPGRTRQAMADAVAGDLLAHGPASTAALVVSHGQAEDLADRIRARLGAAGWLSGPVVTGPGWTADRDYQAGDRILCHTRHGTLVNGSVVTVTAVTKTGIVAFEDGGDEVMLPLGFVTGVRPDGSPNVSHAWTRTMDGAQGGTWDHAHLLGTPALDAYRGYTGQSRARHPTHTWNTVPLAELDVGGRPVDCGEPASQVAAALTRAPDVTFAADDDPWVVHDRLTGEIAAHQAVLDRWP